MYISALPLNFCNKKQEIEVDTWVAGIDRFREQILSSDDYRTIKGNLMEDVHDAIVLQITPSVISHYVSFFPLASIFIRGIMSCGRVSITDGHI